jgi:hypothetical protein
MKSNERKCEWCNGTSRGDVCPRSLDCPECLSKAGLSCKRPSGHRASEIHKARITAAFAIDDTNGFDWKLAYADKIEVSA